jgi:hypothetical protein
MKPIDDERSLALRLEEVRESVRDWGGQAGFWTWVARILGVGLIGVWVWVIWWKIGIGGRLSGEDGGSAAAMGGGFGLGLVSFGCLVFGVVLLAPPLVPWVAAPLLRFIDSVYIGGHEIERPRLTYEVAERLLRERRWEAAAGEFERIAYWHPREERAWSEAIRCSVLAGDEAGADWLWRRARLRCPAVRRHPPSR